MKSVYRYLPASGDDDTMIDAHDDVNWTAKGVERPKPQQQHASILSIYETWIDGSFGLAMSGVEGRR